MEKMLHIPCGYGGSETMYVELNNKVKYVGFSIEGYDYSGFQSANVTLNLKQVRDLHAHLTNYLESVKE